MRVRESSRADSLGAGAAGGAAGAYIELLTCAVQGRFRRRGVGRLLVQWVLRLARAHGITTVLVAAGSDADDFWRSLDFEEPPAQVPRAWIERLQRAFEHTCVLYTSPLAEADGLAERPRAMQDAIEQLRAKAGGPSRPKKQRRV